MFGFVLLGVLVSLDNLRASVVLGTLKLGGVKQRRIMMLAFGLCESLMPLVGLMIGQAVAATIGKWADWIGPLLLLTIGVLVSYGELQHEKTERVLSNPWFLIALPFSLSLDNLLVGVGIGTLETTSVVAILIVGGVSGLMTLTGFYLGGWVRRFLPDSIELVSGVLLIVFAIITIVMKAI